jgi:hypothetical protein
MLNSTGTESVTVKLDQAIDWALTAADAAAVGIAVMAEAHFSCSQASLMLISFLLPVVILA